MGGIDIGRALQNAASTALETFSGQLKQQPSGAMTTTAQPTRSPGTVPAGQQYIPPSGNATAGEQPGKGALPTWSWWVIGIGVLVIVVSVVIVALPQKHARGG